MKTLVLLIMLFFSFNTLSQEKGSTKFSLNIGSALVHSNYLLSPELDISYTIIKNRLFSNLGMGMWTSLNSNYKYSNNGMISNYQKLGFSYKLINNNILLKKVKVINKNKKIKIIKRNIKKTSGLFIGMNLINNTFINGENNFGYSIKSFYLFQNSLTLGYEFIDTSSDKKETNFKIHSLNIGVMF